MSCHQGRVRIKSQNRQAGDWLEVGDGGESVTDESLVSGGGNGVGGGAIY